MKIRYLLFLFGLVLVSCNRKSTTGDALVPTVTANHAVDSLLAQLGRAQEPYLFVAPNARSEHLRRMLRIDPDYLEELRRDSGVAAHYSYLTGENYQAQTEKFWRYFKSNQERATLLNAALYRGSDMRPITRWLIQYHFVSSFGTLTQEQRDEFIAYNQEIVDILYDTATSTREANVVVRLWHNFHSDIIAALAYYALVFPNDTERSAKFLRYFIEQFEAQMQHAVFDGGAWNESPRYHGAILRTWVPLLRDLNRLGGINLFANEGFRSMLSWMARTQSPPDVQKGIGRVPAVGDGVWTPVWFAYLAMAAPEYVASDPVFAGQLMHAWWQAGAPAKTAFNGAVKNESYNPGDIDPDIAVHEPQDEVGFVASMEKGHAILQDRRDPNESWWLLFRCGQPSLTVVQKPTHDHPDTNSFSLFAFGHPMSLDPGIEAYNDDVRDPWYSTSQAHNTVMFDKRQLDFDGGHIVLFESKPDYELVIGDGSTAGGVKKFLRHILYVRNSYYVIWDDIEHDGNATFYLHGIADELQVDGNNATFWNSSGYQLDAILFGVEPNAITTSIGDLAHVPEWSTQQHTLIAFQQDANAGFLSVLHPRRPGTPALHAELAGPGQLIVQIGDRTDTISFNELSWSLRRK